MRFIFGRGTFTELWIRLTSDEPLGLLDSDYIEDYFGNDGFLTLHHVSTATDFSISMLPVPQITPDVSNDVFQGVYSPLSDLPDGDYELRGRVRDSLWNYTILSSVQTPFGNERVIELILDVETSSPIYNVDGGFIVIRLGVQFDLSRQFELFDLQRETSL